MAIAKIYAKLIQRGAIALKDVPPKWREAVEVLLNDTPD